MMHLFRITFFDQIDRGHHWYMMTYSSLMLRFSILALLFWASEGSKGSILVVGSTNADVIIPVSRFPDDGENVVAKETAEAGRTYAGGKGAIQAVACAKLDTPIRFVTQFGCDRMERC